MSEKKNLTESMLIQERRHKKRKRRKLRKKISVITLLMLAIGIGIVFTPIFNISEIEVSGNSKINSDELIKKSGFVMGENTFKFKLKKSGDEISEIPYVNTVLIERILPGKIRISITECVPVAYVPGTKDCAVIDRYGKVLESDKNGKNLLNIPYLYDFKLDSFSIGKKINVKDTEKLKKTLEITENLYNNNLIEKVGSINSVDGKYFINLRGGLKILVGSGEELNSKFSMITEVLSKLPENATGTLDATDNNRIYHRP